MVNLLVFKLGGGCGLILDDQLIISCSTCIIMLLGLPLRLWFDLLKKSNNKGSINLDIYCIIYFRDLSKKERALGEEVAEGRRNKISDDDVNEHNEALKSKKSPGRYSYRKYNYTKIGLRITLVNGAIRIYLI